MTAIGSSELYPWNYGITTPGSGTVQTQYTTEDPNAPGVFQAEGLSKGLLIAEDAIKSGAMIAGELALEAAEEGYLDAVDALSGTNGTTATGATSEEIQEEIDRLEEEKANNIEEMEKIEDHIQDLVDSAKENIAKAAALQEEAVKEHQEEVDKALEEQLNAYIEANKEGGEGMTRDELQANIKGALPGIPEVGDAVAALAAASKEVSEIDTCLGELNKLIADTKLIDDEIKIKEGEYEAAVEAETCPPPQTNCEPQGFQDSEGNQYDFFIDKDGNSDLSNETEFLGYEGGKEGQAQAWAEMTELDTNLDGIVDAQELSAGGVMVYKTDANGNQQAMTIEEAFGEDSDLAISTTQHDEAKEGVGPNNFNTGVGSENNELWGTFDVTLNGETLDGYQTNDDLDWLKNNYNFTDYANEATLTENTDPSSLEYSEELQPHVNFYNEYTEISEQLKANIQAGYENIGLSQEQMDGINDIAKREADEDAKNFFASLNLNEDDMTEEKVTEGTEVDPENPEEKDEEELLIEEQLAA